jgi:hypothetical protein
VDVGRLVSIHMIDGPWQLLHGSFYNTGQYGFSYNIWKNGNIDISIACHRQRTMKMQDVLWDVAPCSLSGRCWPHVSEEPTVTIVRMMKFSAVMTEDSHLHTHRRENVRSHLIISNK